VSVTPTLPTPADLPAWADEAVAKRSAARERLRDIVAEHGPDALLAVAPVRWQPVLDDPDVDPSNPSDWVRPRVRLEPVLHPIWVDTVALAWGAMKSARSMTIRPTVAVHASGLAGLLGLLPGAACYPNTWKFGAPACEESKKKAHRPSKRASQLRTAGSLADVPGFEPAGMHDEHPTEGPLAASWISVSGHNGDLNLRVRTLLDPLDIDTRVGQWTDAVRPGKPLCVDEAAAIAAYLAQHDLFADPDGILARFAAALGDGVIVRPVGAHVPNLAVVITRDGDTVSGREREALHAHSDYLNVKDTGASGLFACHFDVADMARMAKAKPALIEGLQEHQTVAVGQALAGRRGRVNSAAVGGGKTVITLAGWRAVSHTTPAFRGIVMCPPHLREQWVDHIHGNPDKGVRAWFPEARSLCLQDTVGGAEVRRFLANAGDDPAVLVCGFPQVVALIDTLASFAYDRGVVDDLTMLRQPGTPTYRALWQMRPAVGFMEALDATPMSRSLDNIGNLLGYAFGDPHAASALQRRYPRPDPKTIDNLWRDVFGPAVFRIDRSQFSHLLPTMLPPQVVALEPSDAEREGSDLIRYELERTYGELLLRLEEAAAKGGAESAAYKEAAAELVAKRREMLGAIQVARLFAVDPLAVADMTSVAAGVLVGSGLIAKAAKAATKRRHTAGLLADIQGETRGLVFSEFPTALRRLQSELEGLGVRAGLYSGGQTRTQRRAVLAAWYAGELDSLLLSPAGTRGLNLQQAGLIVHYDLPYIPDAMVQRNGRGDRIGATVEEIEVVIPVLKGSIEERVCALLLPRAAHAHAVLDGHRGVHGLHSELGMAAAGLEQAIGAKEARGLEVELTVAAAVLRR
jgi:hypothetical protein